MVSIIAAVAANGAIGRGNKLIYWLPNDLRRFRELTTGHAIVMGRRTFESLPKGALPNRRNMVLSRGGARFAGAETFGSLEEALAACAADDMVYIIGGASVYAQAMPLADRLCLTEVDDEPRDADAFFPAYGSGWKAVRSERHERDARHAYAYKFTDYTRENETIP